MTMYFWTDEQRQEKETEAEEPNGSSEAEEPFDLMSSVSSRRIEKMKELLFCPLWRRLKYVVENYRRRMKQTFQR